MTQEAVERLLGRLLTDDRFRRSAVTSIERAAAQEGYQLSDEEVQALKPDDLMRLENVAAQLDRSIKRFGCGQYARLKEPEAS